MIAPAPEVAPPAPVSPPAKRRGRKRRLLFRTGVRLATLLLLGAAALLSLVLFTPVSFQEGDDLLRKHWRSATGLDLQFDRAEWSLSRGNVFIQAPVIRDIETGENLFELQSFEIKVDPWTLLRTFRSARPIVSIPQIMAVGPMRLDFEEKDGTFRADRRMERARQVFNTRRKTWEMTGNPLDFRIGTLSASGIDLGFTRVEGASSSRVLAIQDSMLLAEFGDSPQPTNLVLVGNLLGRSGATRFNLIVQPRMGQEEMAVDLSVQRFDSSEHLLLELVRNFRTSPMKARGNLRHEPNGDWRLYTLSQIPEFTLVGGQPGQRDQVLRDAVLEATLGWTSVGKKLELVAADFKSSDCDFVAKGSFGLDPPYPYQVHLDPVTLRSEALSMIEDSVFGSENPNRHDKGRFELRGDVHGAFDEPRPRAVVGKVSFQSAALTLPSLPEPVQDIRFLADVTTSSLQIRDGYGLIKGVPINVTGMLRGLPVEGRVDSVELDWRSAGDISGLSDILAANAGGAPSNLRFHGDVTGTGHIRVINPNLEDGSKVLDRAEIEGRILFNDAELTHKDLAKPVKNLSGTLDFKRGKASLSKFTGRIEDFNFSVGGTLSGPKNFWEQTDANLRIEADLQLASLPDYARWVGETLPGDVPPLEGRAKVVAMIKGPIERRDDLNVSGSIGLSDFRLRLQTAAAAGTLKLPRADLTFSPREVVLAPTRGVWSGVEVALEAALLPNDLTGSVKLDGPLLGCREMLPRVFRDLDEVGGNVNADLRVSLTRADPSAARVTTIGDLWAQIAEKSQDKKASLLDWIKPEASGQIKLSDAELLFETMPSSARISHIYGTLALEGHTLRSVSPVQLQAGSGAANTLADAVISFPSGPQPVTLDFKVKGQKADLDDWVKPWRKADPDPEDFRISGSPFDPEAKPKVRITVQAETQQVRFRGLDGTSLRGFFTFEGYGRHRAKFAWREIEAGFKEGSVRVSGDFTHEDDRERERHTAEVNRVNVADLFFMGYRQPAQGGLQTGFVTGNVSIEKDGPEHTPFTGKGHLVVQESRFVSSSIFGALGGVLDIEPFFREIAFSKIEGDFRVADRAVSTDELLFEHPLKIHPLNLRVQGTIGPARQVNLLVHLQFLPGINDIPVVGIIWQTINRLTGTILSYRVTGSLDLPAVEAQKTAP